jgi:hypothetical protein
LIVSSGYSNTPVMSEFRKYGFADVLSKPWTPVELSQVLRRCDALGKRSKPGELDVSSSGLPTTAQKSVTRKTAPGPVVAMPKR